MATADAIAALQEHFPGLGLTARPLMVYADGRESGQQYVRVAPDDLLEVMRFLRDDPRACFEQLADVTCVDYLNYPDAEDRYGVVFSLLSHTHNHRLWVKVYVNDPEPTVPSMTAIWRGAEWPEREVFDLFGVRFAGHPDMRRIVLPQNFEDHPLRKDYPLRGRGERTDLDVVTRDTA